MATTTETLSTTSARRFDFTVSGTPEDVQARLREQLPATRFPVPGSTGGASQFHISFASSSWLRRGVTVARGTMEPRGERCTRVQGVLAANQGADEPLAAVVGPLALAAIGWGVAYSSIAVLPVLVLAGAFAVFTALRTPESDEDAEQQLRAALHGTAVEHHRDAAHDIGCPSA